MPLHIRQGTRAVRVHGPPYNAARLVHLLDVIAGRRSIVEGVGVRHRLDERDARHQVDELLNDPGDADAVRLALVVGDDSGTRLQRQEGLRQPGCLAGCAPEAPPERVNVAYALCRRLLGRLVPEYGALCHGDGAHGRDDRRRRVP